MKKARNTSIIARLLIGLLGFSMNWHAEAQTVTTVTTAGASSWTSPAGVYLVQVEAWGGGGGGGGAKVNANSGNSSLGGGGGGGAYAKLNVYNVTPSTAYSYTVGAAGTAGVGSTSVNGGNGGDTFFVNATTVKAVGGTGGVTGVDNTKGAGSSGGASASCVGDVKFSGGTGATATTTSFGGQGGGSGGTAANGNNGAANTGGQTAAVTGGGPGGAPNATGGSSSGGQAPATGPGGGGGGGRRGSSTSTSSVNGGAGFAGQLVLTYYAQPTSQATVVSFASPTSSSVTVSWTRGNGGNCLVLIKDGGSVDSNPVNGSAYTANSVFGSGSQIGTGNYVVYQGTGSSVDVTGLTTGHTYNVAVYELNGVGTALVTYLTASPATGSTALGSTAPGLGSPTKSAITDTTATLGATLTTDNSDPVTEYGIVWSTSANPTTADHKVQVGTTLSPSTAFTVGVTGLPAGSTVHYRGYAINSGGTGYSGDDSFATWAAEPVTQASGVTMTSNSGGAMNLNWTRGSGSTCLVLMKAGSAVDANPTDAVSYTGDANFGSGGQLGTGNYVVYVGTGNAATVTALTPGATYHVAVYEFNGSAGTQNYLTTAPARASQTTVATNVTYYSFGGTAGTPNSATVLANWWTGTAGTGANPANFTGGDKFVLQSGTYYNITNTTWTVSGGATVQLNSGGTLQLEAATTSTLKLGGNMVNNGTLKANGTASTVTVQFISTGGTNWTWTGSGDFSTGTKLGLTVDAGVTLDASGMDAPGFKFPTANNTSATSISGTLNMGARTIDGGNAGGNTKNTFALNAGGTLITAHAGGVGAGTGSSAAGTLFNYASGKVTLNTAANFAFTGTANQAAGAALPATVNNVSINNTGGSGNNTVTLPAITISGLLTIQNGLLAPTATSTAGALTFNGTTLQAGGTWGSTSSAAANQDASRFASTDLITVNTATAATSTSYFRSHASGNWNSVISWEVSNDSGTTWSYPPDSTPGSTHSVFIQAGHAVSLTQNEACGDLHLNAASSTVALGVNTLALNGKLRCYTGSVGTTPGTSSTSGFSVYPFTASSGGKVSVVGSSRNLTVTGEWSATITTASTGSLPLSIDLTSGQTATLGTSIKFSSLEVNSGTLDASASRLAADVGVAGSGNITINSGGTIRSAQSGTGAGSQVMSQVGSSRAGTLTLNAGGVLDLAGTTPCIDMSTVVLNGTVRYSKAGAQTFLAKSGNDASAVDLPTYANLDIAGTGTKTLAVSSTVNGTLSLAYTSGTPCVAVPTALTLGLSANPVTVTVAGGTPLGNGSYVLASAAGTGAVTGTVGTLTLAGAGAGGGVTNLTITGSQLVLGVIVPTANSFTITRGSGMAYKLRKTDVMTHASPPTGETIALTGWTSPTANAVTLSSDADFIYIPAETVNDSFTYTVTASPSGSTATATISVNVQTSTGQASGSIDTTGGTPTVTFYGVVGSSYTVQVSPDATTWSDLVSTNAPANGVITYTDQAPPTPAAFYRLKYNP